MVKAIAAFGCGYEPSSMDKLSDCFLSKEKRRIEKSITLVRESWPHTGYTVLLRTQGCFHVNIFVSSPRGLIFLRAVDIDDSDEEVDMFTSVLTDAIVEARAINVLQIISHIDHACKSTKSLISSKFPYILWSPCTSHYVRILMEEVAELKCIKPVVLCAKGIEQCILMNHHAFPCESPDPFSAKFAPSYCFALQDVVVSKEWKQWKHSILKDILIIEASILGDEFWSNAHMMLQLFKPFAKLLAMLDIDKSVMGAVYDWRVQAVEVVRSKEIDETALNQLEVLIENKWNVLFSLLQAAGYILNPRYFERGQAKDKSIMQARWVLRKQLSSYWRLEGSFGEEDALDCRDKMDPVAWWENFGFETPHLQTLAIKVLSQVSTISMCQDIWQGDYFLCQKALNKLGTQRVKDLVFVRNNLRIHSQKSGSSSSSVNCARNVNMISFPYGVKSWDYAHLEQTKVIVNIHDELL
ncbi:protein of unknown function DUF659 - like 4 [Theobroma cacao]|nr:protein of unknown function DUF659 - like 4 [Theobroma cacao]